MYVLSSKVHQKAQSSCKPHHPGLGTGMGQAAVTIACHGAMQGAAL